MLLTTDDADDGLLAAAAGVTPDLRRFLFALDEPSFLHAARTIPSPDSGGEGRLPWEEDHIAAVLAHVTPLRNLHASLVPEQLSEHLFWDTYFQLCKGLLGERDSHAAAAAAAAQQQQGAANPMLTPPSMQTLVEAASPRSRETQDAEELRLLAVGGPSAPQLEAPVPPVAADTPVTPPAAAMPAEPLDVPAVPPAAATPAEPPAAAVEGEAAASGDAPASPPPPAAGEEDADVEQYLAGELGDSDADDETLEHEDLEALLASGGSSASLQSASEG